MERLRALRFSEKSVPIALLLLCGLAFGVLIPWLGFYWDDWPLAWFSHALGPAGFIGFAEQRPFSGVLYFLSASLLGEVPLLWQIYALIWRWLSAVALWWLLRLLWPKREREATVTALVFVLYPGFSQQSIALIYSLYFIYYTLFLCSLGVMLWSLRQAQWRGRLTLLGLALSLGAMLSTEYFYGLELLRPLFIWFVIAGEAEGFSARLRSVALRWAPYLLLVVAVFAWRFTLSQEVSYDVDVFEDLAASPIGGSVEYLTTIIQDVFEATVLAWGQTFGLADLRDFGLRVQGLYWGVLILALTLAAFYLSRFRGAGEGGEEGQGNWMRQALVLGGGALLIGGLSFWITNLPIRLGYPWDRGTLPLAFGASLLLAALIGSLSRVRWLQLGVTAILVSLAVGFHYETGTSYLKFWRLQKDFYQQLLWRAPALKTNTIVLTRELPLEYYTDNSLTGPLNWIYAPELDTLDLPYFLNFVGRGWGSSLPPFESGLPIELAYRAYTFRGTTSQAIVLHYEPGQCLRVLNPAYDERLPKLPEALIEALPLSNPAGTILDSGASAVLPAAQFGASQEVDWCYYFQKADLARQMGDWEAVLTLGREAFGAYDYRHPAELLPFIQAYAQLGDWERAGALTVEAYAYKGDERMQPLLCTAWEHFAEGIQGAEAEESIAAIRDQIFCK